MIVLNGVDRRADALSLEIMIDAISDHAIYMIDKDGVVLSWNTGAERLKLYQPADIIGRDFSCFYTEEDRARGRPRAALVTARAEGRFVDEGWRVRKDGSRFWASVVIRPIRDEAGALQGYAKVTRDLTEQRQREVALHETERRFRLLVEAVTDHAIFMLSPNGRVENWNAGARAIKGYDADEVIGRHFSMFYTAEDRAAGAPEAALYDARTLGRYHADGWRVRRDGSRFPAHVVIHPIYDPQGKLIGYTKITRDLTATMVAEGD
jgi:PAS domain S-box-containing protein